MTQKPLSDRPDRSLHSRLIVFLVGFAMLCVWLVPVGYRDLMETDEGRYAEISREMVQTHDWVTPRLDGLKYFEKPALQYWATAVVFSVAGESAFTARLYTALCALFSVLLIWLTGRRLWGSAAGNFSGLSTASMVWMIGGSQVPSLDMSLTFYLTVALCGFLLAEAPNVSDAIRRRWLLAVWAAMAAAVLTKGLIGLLIPGTTLVIYSALQRDLSVLRRLEWLRGGALFALISVPWFVMVSFRNSDFLHFFFIREHFERYLTTEHHRAGAIYYFVPLLIAGSLPWTPLIPAAIVRAVKAPKSESRPLNVLLIWCGFVFTFFSLSGSKLPFYILPLFPALGLLLGNCLSRVSARGLVALTITNAAFWLLVAVAAPLTLLHYKYNESMPREVAVAFAPWTAVGPAAIAVFTGLAARQAMRNRRTMAIVLMAIGSLVGFQFMVSGFQNFSSLRSTHALADEIKDYVHPQTELFEIGAYDQTLPFYLDRTLTVVNFSGELEMGQTDEPDKWIPDIDSFKQRWMASTDALAVTTPALAERLRTEGLPMQIVGTEPRRVAFVKPSVDFVRPTQ